MRVVMFGTLLLLTACSGPTGANVTVADTVSLNEGVGNDAGPNRVEPATEPLDQAVAMRGAEIRALPADVTVFKTRRDQCDHFRGEEPSDDARAAELEAALARTCTGTDAALTDLRNRYAHNDAVIAALADYDSAVE